MTPLGMEPDEDSKCADFRWARWDELKMPRTHLLDRNYIHSPDTAGDDNECAESFLCSGADPALIWSISFGQVDGRVGRRVALDVPFAFLVAVHRNAPLLRPACHGSGAAAHYGSNGAYLITSAAFPDTDSWR